MAEIPEQVAEELSPPQASPRRRSMFRLSLLIFLCGVVLGVAATLLVSRLTERPDRRPPFIRDPQKRNQVVQDYLAGRLHLSAEQKDSLKTMMEASFQNLETIRNEFVPKMQAETDRFSAEFATTLTDEQKKIWEEEIRNFHRKFFPRRDKGHNGPHTDNGQNPPPMPPHPEEQPGDGGDFQPPSPPPHS